MVIVKSKITRRGGQKSKILLIFMAIIIAVLYTTPKIYAQDITFRATVDKDKITLNDEVDLTLTVTGSQDTGTPQLPVLDGFEVVSSGSSSQFSFINGKMSASKSFSYRLVPTKEGKFTIPPATIDVGNETLKTEPITVEVAKGGQTPTASTSAGAKPYYATPQSTPITPERLKDRLFIEVATDKSTAYIGEQITMTFKLYHRGVAIDNLQYIPPVTKGFVLESMGSQKEYRDVVNGVAYDVVELKTAIFPATVGELTIEPAKLKCDILLQEQKQNRSKAVDSFFDDFFNDPFFSSYVRYPLALESNPLTITIKPLPQENKPSTFKGSVGKYDLTVEASPQSLKAGEPINLLMKISGAGNIPQVNEPVIQNLNGFKSYESETKTDITGRDPLITGQKTFQKMIIPQDENIKEIPIIEFSYFDPASNQYNSIQKGPIPINVAPAPKKETGIVELIKDATRDNETKKAVTLLAKDIHFIETSPGTFSEIKNAWYQNKLLWIIIVMIPCFLLIISFIYKTHSTKLQIDVAYAKAKGASKIAHQLLNEAVRYQKQNKTKEFYDAVAKAIQKFISDRLNLPVGTVSASSIETLLKNHGIKEDISKSIKNILDICDLVRFGAHSATPSEMKQAVKTTEHIIGVLNKKL